MATQTLSGSQVFFGEGEFKVPSVSMTKAATVAAVSSAAVLTTTIAAFNDLVSKLITAGLVSSS